ncbi:cupredoxin family copper-binding protein [Sphingomonas sp. KR3-1]|uniref:cupredoxin domain-containing protein n=1 Tax=Sphingomonas sp. KR3-1 TaxID=3156611 RepID=UPI0032B466BD
MAFPLSRALFLAAFSVPMLGLGVSVTAAAIAPAPAVQVAIKGFAFTPQVLTVAIGTTVTWTNADEDPHTVTATDRSFHSAALDTGGKFSYTFTRAGEFAYFCQLHPHMTGKVIVKAR